MQHLVNPPPKTCVVMHQGFSNPVFNGKNNYITYPEQGYTLTELVCGVAFEEPIITESPFIISNYRRESVWIFRDGQWVNPEMETFGASFNRILSVILLHSPTICDRATLDKVKQLYATQNSQKLSKKT